MLFIDMVSVSLSDEFHFSRCTQCYQQRSIFLLNVKINAFIPVSTEKVLEFGTEGSKQASFLETDDCQITNV